jgi:hypothetical protein
MKKLTILMLIMISSLAISGIIETREFKAISGPYPMDAYEKAVRKCENAGYRTCYQVDMKELVSTRFLAKVRGEKYSEFQSESEE